MNIAFPKTMIELSPEETIELYYALKRDIIQSIKSHWVNFPDSYKQLESRRLQMLVALSRSVGHEIDVLEQLENELAKAIKAKGAKP